MGVSSGWRNGCIPPGEEAVRAWLEALGLSVRSKAGIRIFHDYLPAAMRNPESLNELLAVERAFRKHKPFAALGHHLHLICEWAR